MTVANKLWWEHWPEEDATTELAASLGRMGFDHVDLVYAIAPPPHLSVPAVVAEVGDVLASGRARTWGVGMWTADQLAEAIAVCDRSGVPRPVAAQMSCSVADHAQAADPVMRATLTASGVGLVAAHVLAGGTLTGKYVTGARGRASDDDSPAVARGQRIAVSLARLAAQWGVAPTHLAFCYALGHPNLASVLFGATSPEQVRTNVESVDVYGSLDAGQLAAITALADDIHDDDDPSGREIT